LCSFDSWHVFLDVNIEADDMLSSTKIVNWDLGIKIMWKIIIFVHNRNNEFYVTIWSRYWSSSSFIYLCTLVINWGLAEVSILYDRFEFFMKNIFTWTGIEPRFPGYQSCALTIRPYFVDAADNNIIHIIKKGMLRNYFILILIFTFIYFKNTIELWSGDSFVVRMSEFKIFVKNNFRYKVLNPSLPFKSPLLYPLDHKLLMKRKASDLYIYIH